MKERWLAGFCFLIFSFQAHAAPLFGGDPIKTLGFLIGTKAEGICRSNMEKGIADAGGCVFVREYLPTPMPRWFLEALQPFYKTRLHKVNFYFKKPMLRFDDRMILTIGHNIYFPIDYPDLKECARVHEFAHELTHVDQYDREGGVEKFLNKYMDQTIESYKQSGYKVTIHDQIPLEREANEKGKAVTNWFAVNRLCDGRY